MLSKKNIGNQIYWYNIANYLGYFFSFIASFYIFPNNLELLGELKYIETLGHFIFPLLLFGLPQSLIRFNPLMQPYHLPRFYGTSIVIVIFISTIIFLLIVITNYFFSFSKFNYYIYGFILAICYSFIDLNKSISIIYNKVRLPIFLEKLLPKFILPFFFILLLKKIIENNEMINYYLILHLLLVIVLFMVTSKNSII